MEFTPLSQNEGKGFTSLQFKPLSPQFVPMKPAVPPPTQEEEVEAVRSSMGLPDEFESYLKKYKVTDYKHPESHYDYFSAYKAGVVPKLWDTLPEKDKAEDIAQGRQLKGKYMWPDEFKLEGHPVPPKKVEGIMDIPTHKVRDWLKTQIGATEEALRVTGETILKPKEFAKAGVQFFGDVVSGLTLGNIDPRTGMATVPFTSIRGKYAKPLKEALGAEKEVSPIPGEMLGITLPWVETAKLISLGYNFLKGIGKTQLAKIGEVTVKPLTKVKVLIDAAERVGIQAATGATVGSAFPAESPENRLSNVAWSALYGAGLQSAAEVINVPVGLKAVNRVEWYNNAKKAFKDLFMKTGTLDLTPEEAEYFASRTVNKFAETRGVSVEDLAVKDLKNITRRVKDKIAEKTEVIEPEVVEPEPTPKATVVVESKPSELRQVARKEVEPTITPIPEGKITPELSGIIEDAKRTGLDYRISETEGKVTLLKDDKAVKSFEGENRYKKTYDYILESITEKKKPVDLESKAKQPWEMTKKEYEKELLKYEKLATRQEMAPEEGRWAGRDDWEAYRKGDWESFSRARGYSEEAISNFKRYMELSGTNYNFDFTDITPSKIHRQFIKQALSEGKPVPEEVLKDYPELRMIRKKKPVDLEKILMDAERKAPVPKVREAKEKISRIPKEPIWTPWEPGGETSLLKIIQSHGGISSRWIKNNIGNPGEILGEHGLLSAMQERVAGKVGKGYRHLDELAEELMNKGVIPRQPESLSGPDWIVELLRAERRGTAKKMLTDLTSVEEREARKALKEEWKNEGLTESEINTRLGEVQGSFSKDFSSQIPVEKSAKAEKAVDPDFIDEKEIEERPVTEGELFDTSKVFTLMGERKEVKEFVPPEIKQKETLFKPPKREFKSEMDKREEAEARLREIKGKTIIEGFQGKGLSPELIYGKEAVEQGRAIPILGKGDYIAFNKEDAAMYGEVSAKRIELKKPLIIDSDKIWGDVLQKADANVLNSGNREFYEHPERIPEATEGVQKYLISQGYDGVIIKISEGDINERGEKVKRLRESFGHSQAVKFIEKKEMKKEKPRPEEKEGIRTGEDFVDFKSFVESRGFVLVRLSDKQRSKLIKEFNSVKSEADFGGYADLGDYEKNLNPSILQMPELVEFYRSISGEFPWIVKRLRAGMGMALGQFSPKTGEIKLRADIFKDINLALKVMAHEIGHWVDWLPDKQVRRGNILGRIATLIKYQRHMLEEYPGAPAGELTPSDRERLRREAERIVAEEKKIAEGKTGEDIGVTPEDILAIWNDASGRTNNKALYEFIAKASTAEKKSIIKTAMQGEVPPYLQELIKREIPYTDWDAKTKEVFQRLLEEELKKRKLYELDTVRNELKQLTQMWKPFDETLNAKYTKYRYSSKELYADAISVLFNHPQMLKDVAPEFYKAFFAYLEKKPEVRSLWYDTQALLGNREALLNNREKAIIDDFQKGTELRREEKRKQWSTFGLKKALIDTNIRLYQLKKLAGEKGIPVDPEHDPTYWIEELPYKEGKVYELYLNTENKVVKPASENGISLNDIGLYLFARRVATERAGMANPRGFEVRSALDELEWLRQRLGTNKIGEEKFPVLERLIKDYWTTSRQERVFPEIESAELYSDDLMGYIKKNENYAPFRVLGMLEGKYGKEITAHIYKQHGTLKEIDNPFIQLVLVDSAMLRAAQVKKCKVEVIKSLRLIDEEYAKPAKYVYDKNFKYMRPVESDDPEEGLLIFPHKGKIQGWYVEKDIADLFQYHPYEARALIGAFMTVSQILKAILVNKNPIWMLRNPIRDFEDFLMKTPGASVTRVIPYYADAFKAAYGEVFKGQNPQVIADMLRKNMLVVNRQYALWDDEQSEYIDRLLTEIPDKPEYKGVKGKLLAILDFLDKCGKVSERIGKIAGYEFIMNNKELVARHVKGQPEMTDKLVAHIVRTLVSTPDVLRRGSASPLYNNLCLFSNVAKEGYRSTWEAYQNDPKHFAWKAFKYSILPKLIMWGMSIGLAGAYYKRIMSKVSDYDLSNYIVIPLYLNNRGEAVIIRIPTGYTGQLVGGLVWKILQFFTDTYKDKKPAWDRVAGRHALLAFMNEQTPYQLNPLLEVSGNIMQYYILGNNPYDYYKGANILPDEVYKAGGLEASEMMLADTWSKVGGSVFYRWDKSPLDRDKSFLEKVLTVPPGTVIGTFLKVTNQGELEEYRRVMEQVKTERAKENRNIYNAIADDLNRDKPFGPDKVFANLVSQGKVFHHLVDFRKNGLRVDEFKNVFTKEYKKLIILKQNKPLLSAFIRATSNEEKQAILRRAFELYPEYFTGGKSAK